MTGKQCKFIPQEWYRTFYMDNANIRDMEGKLMYAKYAEFLRYIQGKAAWPVYFNRPSNGLKLFTGVF